MNRRKPRLDVAVVPRAAGEDAETAILRKASRAAVAAFSAQDAGQGDGFAAGYLAGHARQQALKHGLDAEEDGLAALLRQLVIESPERMRPHVAALVFAKRAVQSPRAGLGASDSRADAGYLVGHLESLCGTKRLLGLAPKQASGPDAVAVFLTACDTAADRLQTHHPTAVLRFDADERAVLREALA